MCHSDFLLDSVYIMFNLNFLQDARSNMPSIHVTYASYLVSYYRCLNAKRKCPFLILISRVVVQKCIASIAVPAGLARIVDPHYFHEARIYKRP